MYDEVHAAVLDEIEHHARNIHCRDVLATSISKRVISKFEENTRTLRMTLIRQAQEIEKLTVESDARALELGRLKLQKEHSK